jgi:uncharacterized protein YukE
MADPDAVYANAKIIRSLADEIQGYTTKVNQELNELDAALKRLGTTWADEGYTKFRSAFDRLRAEFVDLAEEIGRRKPELQKDAELLIAYMNTPQP